MNAITRPGRPPSRRRDVRSAVWCASALVIAALLPAPSAAGTEQRVLSGAEVRSPRDGRTVVFREEFTSLSARRWNTRRTTAYSHGTRNPRDNKLDRISPAGVSVKRGAAHFRSVPPGRASGKTHRSWATGLMTTEGTKEGFRVRTGDFLQVRARLPRERGAWPGLWTWRRGGNEVDVFEYHPDMPSVLEFHNQVRSAGYYYRKATVVGPGRWVTVGVLLGSRDVRWYVNGRQVFRDRKGVGRSWSAHLVLNLSLSAGKHHPRPRRASPPRFTVDHVRVWR